MKNRFFLLSFLLYQYTVLNAQDSLSLKKKAIPAESIMVLKSKQSFIQFKLPQFKQGFFCNMEDQLNRKKVPLNFNLGNSKY